MQNVLRGNIVEVDVKYRNEIWYETEVKWEEGEHFMERFPEEAKRIMVERFGKDSLIALATSDGEWPSIRMVNSFYEDGNFYAIMNSQYREMQHIEQNPKISISGEWFSAHGLGENLGHILDPNNAIIASKLRAAFAQWYYNGYSNESDPNTCILRIHLIEADLMANGIRYEIGF